MDEMEHQNMQEELALPEEDRESYEAPQEVLEDSAEEEQTISVEGGGGPDTAPQATGGTPDFAGQARELLRYHPELRGQQLPDEVLRACVNGENLLSAYRGHQSRVLQAENSRLQRELEVERCNARNRTRAPVVGVSGGAPVRERGEDDFLRGFNEED